MPQQSQRDWTTCATRSCAAAQPSIVGKQPTTVNHRRIRSHATPARRLASVAWLVLAVLALAACAAPAQPRRAELVVFAAASLTDAFTEIGAAFTAESGVAVTFNFAGSQTLAGQLASGAPADVFASANDRQMQAAVDAVRIDPATVRTFAANRLVVVTPRDNPAAIAAPADLAAPGLKLVLADGAVPVGQYSLQFLANASADSAYTATYSPTVLANVVSYEENVRAVLAKVSLGEADAGIVYSSDVTDAQREQVQLIEIPTALNVIATYPIAPVADSEQSALAQAFVDLVLSPAGQAILERYGFQRVQP